MTDRPIPRLADLLRDREDEVAPLAAKLTALALADDHNMPGDIVVSVMAAAAFLIVELTPPKRVTRRAKDAESMLRKFIRTHERALAADGVDVAKRQSEMPVDLVRAFGDSFRAVMAATPIPPAFVSAGAGDGEHYRKILLANELQNALLDAFRRAWLDHSPDRVTATLASCVAAAVVCAAPWNPDDPDPDGYVDLMVGEFREALVRTMDYWREKGAH